MKRALAWAGFVLGVATALAAPARAADLYGLLRRSATVDRRWSYQGTKELERHQDARPSVITTKVYHRAPDQTLMVATHGETAGSRYLQKGRQHFLQSPGEPYRRVPLPPPIDSTDLLLQNYRLRQMRVEPIAGRKCVMVSIEPRHPGNPRKIVWLDLKTALPLKTQVWDQNGKLSEQSFFLGIQFNARLPAALFHLPATADRQEWPEVTPDFQVLEAETANLPEGYRLIETSVRQTPGGRRSHIVAFQRFSDGLNTLTLLQSVTHPQLGALGGSVAVGGKVGRVNYVICGEQRADLLRRLAGSLR